MNSLVIVLVLGLLVVSTITLGVKAQTTETTLELTVRQVVVEDGVASITGPAASIKVDLYDNLGKELISSGKTGTNGVVTFPLDEKYPLSAKGLFYTTIKVDGTDNGIFTCQQGQACQETLFSIDGLSPDLEDGILIVKVVRSSNLNEPVAGIQFNAWPMDQNGTALKLPIVGFGGKFVYDWSGVVCITNEEGYCAADLHGYFKWAEDTSGSKVSLIVLKFGTIFTYDGASIAVPEGGFSRVSIAVNEKGKLDDCIFKVAPTDKVLNPSCMDKLHQTATAQATRTINPADYEVFNNAMVQASILSKETADLFAEHEPDQAMISKLLENAAGDVYNPASQVKIILYVNRIIHGDYGAAIDKPAFDKTVEITSPNDPDNLLGVCKVNKLGECVSIIDRSLLLTTDGLLEFRVLADGFDNSIMICRDEPVCEQHAYTVSGLTGYKDAIILYKVVRTDDYSIPVENVVITAGGSLSSGYYRGCYSDINGTCPIYMNETGFKWTNEGDGDSASPGAMVNWNRGYFDPSNPPAKDDRLVVYYVAVDKIGKVADCIFTSPLDYSGKSTVCKAKQKALQTAIAGYTATPTITITPLPSATPTATEVPPTPTITLTPSPTPQAGLSDVFTNSRGIVIAVGVLIILIIAGLSLFIWKRKNR
jgi:hypothetical protein